jgi:hypothetical protein
MMTDATTIPRERRRQLCRELLLGAPLAALLWLLLLRLISGQWNWVFPVVILCVSLLMAGAVLMPGVVGSAVYRLWGGLIRCIDWVITRLSCAVLYFLVFTPLGLLLRLLRVPLLQMKPAKSTASMWIKISPKQDARHHFFRQY